MKKQTYKIENRLCETCRNYDPQTSECRRNAPNRRGRWPEVDGRDWCGHWIQNPHEGRKKPAKNNQSAASVASNVARTTAEPH